MREVAATTSVDSEAAREGTWCVSASNAMVQTVNMTIVRAIRATLRIVAPPSEVAPIKEHIAPRVSCQRGARARVGAVTLISRGIPTSRSGTSHRGHRVRDQKHSKREIAGRGPG